VAGAQQHVHDFWDEHQQAIVENAPGATLGDFLYARAVVRARVCPDACHGVCVCRVCVCFWGGGRRLCLVSAHPEPGVGRVLWHRARQLQQQLLCMVLLSARPTAPNLPHCAGGLALALHPPPPPPNPHTHTPRSQLATRLFSLSEDDTMLVPLLDMANHVSLGHGQVFAGACRARARCWACVGVSVCEGWGVGVQEGCARRCPVPPPMPCAPVAPSLPAAPTPRARRRPAARTCTRRSPARASPCMRGLCARASHGAQAPCWRLVLRCATATGRCSTTGPWCSTASCRRAAVLGVLSCSALGVCLLPAARCGGGCAAAHAVHACLQTCSRGV
jgi:hypothetical protein